MTRPRRAAWKVVAACLLIPAATYLSSCTGDDAVQRTVVEVETRVLVIGPALSAADISGLVSLWRSPMRRGLLRSSGR